jgi:Nickel responsive protein SCO4226-like
MAQFLVELYVPRSGCGVVERAAERALLAAQQLTREGTPVRYVRSIFVPADETWFVLCEAGSAEAVRETARRADLRFDRIAEAVTSDNPEGG